MPFKLRAMMTLRIVRSLVDRKFRERMNAVTEKFLCECEGITPEELYEQFEQRERFWWVKGLRLLLIGR